VLVHGAAGGLGSAAVRIAAALGARVSAVASTAERRAAATMDGAHQAYGPAEWLDAVRSGGGAAAFTRIEHRDIIGKTVLLVRPS
jgi:NADPH2:quinone reductase